MSRAAKTSDPPPLEEADYVALAEFRYQLRTFLRHMEERVREMGVHPQQYQLVLAIKGLPPGQAPTIGRLAERMQLNHNSMVELADRTERSGLLRRGRAAGDRRQVTLSVTAAGEALLRKLGSDARAEIQESGPSVMRAIRHLTRGLTGSRK